MNKAKALALIINHSDPEVRRAGEVIRESIDRRTRIIKLIEEALGQVRLDVKYLIFDLEATRKERDEARE